MIWKQYVPGPHLSFPRTTTQEPGNEARGNALQLQVSYCSHTGSQPSSPLASIYKTECPAPLVTEHQNTQPTAEESLTEGPQIELSMYNITYCAYLHENVNVQSKCLCAVDETLYVL